MNMIYRIFLTEWTSLEHFGKILFWLVKVNFVVIVILLKRKNRYAKCPSYADTTNHWVFLSLMSDEVKFYCDLQFGLCWRLKSIFMSAIPNQWF